MSTFIVSQYLLNKPPKFHIQQINLSNWINKKGVRENLDEFAQSFPWQLFRQKF